MSTRMEAFREFISKHPLVKEEVTTGKFTWQRIYENWVILGENDEMWKKYEKVEKNENKKIEDLLTSDNLKNLWGYVKKINPDSISKTLNTVQKVLQITQSFGGKNVSGLYNANYNSWWD